MSLRYKLAFYIFGLFIGFYFVGEFLSAKAKSRGVEFCYFPNCRVIKDIRSKPFKVDKKVDSILKSNKIDLKQIDNSIHNGDVDFTNSNVTYKGGKKYIIESLLPNDKKVTYTLINKSNVVILEEISFK